MMYKFLTLLPIISALILVSCSNSKEDDNKAVNDYFEPYKHHFKLNPMASLFYLGPHIP